MSDKVVIFVSLVFEVPKDRKVKTVYKILDVIKDIDCGALRINEYPKANQVRIDAEFCSMKEDDK